MAPEVLFLPARNRSLKKVFFDPVLCGIMAAMLEKDTICAVSTPPGEGGIGIIRVSGGDALGIVSTIFRSKTGRALTDQASHSVLYGHILDPATHDIVDEVLVSVMRSPATYTREDVVEINCHGGMAPLWRTINLLLASGARQAEPGEFTKRAFLNNRIDLAQAEAVMDIIRAKTDLSLKAAQEQLSGGLSSEIGSLRDRLISLAASVEAGIDFPEEDIETESGQPLAREVNGILQEIGRLLSTSAYGRILRDGFATALVGRPNVGKSSLLNALLKQNRAIVTDVPGTTRDVLEEYLNISGALIRILDTAGIRHSHDLIEQEGVRRSLAAMDTADIVLIVLDGSRELTEEDKRIFHEARGKTAIAVINKSDLPRKLEPVSWPEKQVPLSCKTGEGLDMLHDALLTLMKQGTLQPREHSWAVNQRHRTALERTQAGLLKVLDSIQAGLSPEFISLDLRDSLDSLGLVIGATFTEDILERVFRDFCIGK